jgi:hypothetical protein
MAEPTEQLVVLDTGRHQPTRARPPPVTHAHDGPWLLAQQGYLLLDVMAAAALQGGLGSILTPNANAVVSLSCGTEGRRNALRIIPGAPDPSIGGIDLAVPAAVPGLDLRVTYLLDGGPLSITRRGIVPEPSSAFSDGAAGPAHGPTG